MVRRGGDASQRPGNTQQPLNAGPPPSTIAAQIVNDHARPGQNRQAEQKAPFGQLLKEILKDPASIEDDPNIHAKLISAVARRGLDVLQNDDPFNRDTLFSEAIDSMLVIEVIVRRYPGLLLRQVADEEDSQGPCLFLWLTPKVISLIGQPRLKVLQPKLERLLFAFLNSIRGNVNTLRMASPFAYLYRSYSDGILDAFDSLSLASSHKFKAVVPLSKGIAKIWPESSQLVALPLGCQVTVSSLPQALLICLVAIKAIASHDRQAASNILTYPGEQHDQVWALESCSRLWSHYERLKSRPERIGSEFEFEEMFLETLNLISFDSLSGTRQSCFPGRAFATVLHVYSDLMLGFSRDQPSKDLQRLIASGLIRLRWITSISRLHSPASQRRNTRHESPITERLKEITGQISKDQELFQGLENSLRASIYLWIDPEDGLDPSMQYLKLDRTELLSGAGVSFDDKDLRMIFSDLLRQYRTSTEISSSLRSKRQRLDHSFSEDDVNEHYRVIVMEMSAYLGHNAPFDIAGVHSIISEIYESMNEDKRCELLSGIQMIACTATRSVQISNGVKGRTDVTLCKICDRNVPVQPSEEVRYYNNGEYAQFCKELLLIVTKLIQHPDMHHSMRPRILLTTLIRRLCNHISDPAILDLFQSSVGQWCLRSLTSSVRELRIAASRSITAFLRHDIPEKVLLKNRRETVKFLRKLSERQGLGEQETLILAWGQIARLCDDDELNLALLHLVECLGHPNSLICGIAFNELLSLSEAHDKTVADLFKPYWRNIAVTVVKDLQSRPQKAQQVADLLRMSVSQMLLLTQFDTIPYLVLTKRSDVLRKIAAARNPPASVKDIITHPKRTFAAVLALLLRQQSADAEETVMETLRESAPEFAELDLRGLVNTDPPLIAFELLKATADADETTKVKVRHALQTLAILSEHRRPNSKSSAKKGKALATFFERFILGIMAHFSMIIDSPREPQPFPERRRCVEAIKEMIIMAKEQVSIGLPQIRACLQCALDDKRLRDEAFVAWASLVRAVDIEDLEQLIDQTLSIVAQYWSALRTETQTLAHDLVTSLFEEQNELLKERIESLPSLASIPIFSKLANDINKRKAALDVSVQYGGYLKRLDDESTVVVLQALRELKDFLEINQQFLHESAVSQKPSPVISQLARSLLDARLRFNPDHEEIVDLCTLALGCLGSIDPNRVEAVREKQNILVLSNFEREIEAIDFAAHLLEQVLVKCFHSAANARAQGFIAWAMQELLRFCKFNNTALQQGRSTQSPVYRRWMEMSESTRSTLTPFLSSSYSVQDYSALLADEQTYPIFDANIGHSTWLRNFTLDLLRKGTEGNARMIFTTIARIIRNHDLSIATFMLPFAALNVILGGKDQQVANIGAEMLLILEYQRSEHDTITTDELKQCSENVFQILDYLARWLQEKRRALVDNKGSTTRSGRDLTDVDEIKEIAQISSVERILHGIPAEVISKRAVECGSYARALFHWEQFIRQEKEKAAHTNGNFDEEAMYQHLQDIYAQIDEPDSIEGLSTHLHVLDPAQQVLEHRKAGRWLAAQSWYELSLEQAPDDQEVQVNLLTCLKESGQYVSLLNYVESFAKASDAVPSKVLPFAAEAAWVTGKWSKLESVLADLPDDPSSWNSEFNLGIGKAFLALRKKDRDEFTWTISSVREGIGRGLSPATTASLQACHDYLLKLHALYELEIISGLGDSRLQQREHILSVLERRLEVLGAYASDKQYLLGIRRAALQLSSLPFTQLDTASAWLTSAQLARKSNFTNTAYNAVLHSAELGNDEAKIEHSKLLWKDGYHRQAIHNLEGAIATKAFRTSQELVLDVSVTMADPQQETQNKVAAQAHLLLTKWLDQAGQTPSNEITHRYQNVIKSCARWDKGHYYLGKHYNKILEAEKALPRNKQSQNFLSGEHAKLVIENFTRSLLYGSKYYYQTVPKILTLWLDLGMDAYEASKKPHSETELNNARLKHLGNIHKQLQKYAIERVPAYVFYTAFPQIITRISHPNSNVWALLQEIIVKVAAAHPQQTLWSLLAVIKSTATERSSRGNMVLTKLRERSRNAKKSDDPNINLRDLIVHGTRLTEGLLNACEVGVDTRVSHVSLSRDLGFNMKLAPCLLVVPIEATMIASLPTARDSVQVRKHKAFPRDAVTISSFEDSVLVLSSLQRPRKLTIRGSDGKSYGILCKPKDDLRKDQRLMEFNGMIKRSLQRNAEASKRRLYIKTYGVTPLNEECGTIEWIDNIKPMRDIIMRLYRQKNIHPNYKELRNLLDKACENPPQTTRIFTEQILSNFPPVLYEWFIETFPAPDAWLAARLRYTRSTAVMSIVGHILGLGDRHGENVLLEATTGGIFHVDFNCLFDKGLTFEKPELVPFRLTHNMVDAFGPCGVEGPFRIAAETTYDICRATSDTLLTILETFLWDPTADFMGRKKGRGRTVAAAAAAAGFGDVPETPQEVLDSVRNKLRGLMRGDSVPLGVEGYVEALIKQAREQRNLAAMYIGWCAFF